MTLHDLSRIFLLRKDRAKLHERLDELRAASTSIASPRLDGMTRSPSKRESTVERLAVEMVDTEASIADLDLEIIKAEIDLQRFISSVQDSRMRRILQCRFVDRLSWRDVARNLDGKETEASVKTAVKRFLKSIQHSDINMQKEQCFHG